MPLRLDIKKKLSARSDRVKSVDFHPTEPWVLSALYSGNVFIWDYNTQALVKSIEVSSLPVRCAKFCVRKQWVVTGCDDMNIRIYNYNTTEKVKVIEAHTDYIRYVAVHPSLPYVLSASDDMTIKLWDWDKGWQCSTVFEGHAHYVMMVQWNPKDANIFASASLDRSIKVWGVSNPGGSQSSVVSQPHFSLLGHERGVNSVEYSPSGEKPYLVSGSDDQTVRVWDYQTKQCLQVLSGHSKNVSAACFHPMLPVIVSGSEDGTVRIWHSSTYRLETTLNYQMERMWALSVVRGSTALAIGYDEGTMVVKLGSEEPVASMTQGGKIIWCKGSEVQAANLKLIGEGSSSQDGERVPLSVKDMGSCEIFPQSVAHHPNGRLFAVCGDGEYIIYTAQALRNKSFGQAVEFVWSWQGHYATRDANGKITVFHEFKEHYSFKPAFPVEEIFGGRLLAVRTADFVCFYDWNEHKLIRRIDVSPLSIYWSDSGDQVCLACSDSYYILRHDKDALAKANEAGTPADEDGLESAFELTTENNEKIESAVWVGECLVYATGQMRLQCFVAGNVETLAHLDRQLFILGYMAEQNKLYLIDKELAVVSYNLHVALVEYQSAVSRKDDAAAEAFFKQIPEELHSRVARFLEHQGYKEKALAVTRDPDHRFELALGLNRLQQCAEIIRAASADGSTPASTNLSRWKQLGDVALEHGNFPLALACFQEAKDLSGLLLILTAMGDAKGIRQLAQQAVEAGRANVAVLCYLSLQDVKSCLKVLEDSGRLPEAALFARTYCPSEVSRVVGLWKEDLKRVNALVAQSLADPAQCPDRFPDLALAVKAEEVMAKRRSRGFPPASSYGSVKELMERDVIADVQNLGDKEVEKLFLGGALLSDEDIHAATHTPAAPAPPSLPVHAPSPVHHEPPAPKPVVHSAPSPVAASPVTAAPHQAPSPVHSEPVSAPQAPQPAVHSFQHAADVHTQQQQQILQQQAASPLANGPPAEEVGQPSDADFDFGDDSLA